MGELGSAAHAVGVLDIEREGILGLVLDATRTGIWTWDVGSDLVRWSAETYAIHGLRFTEFAGTGAAFFDLVHPDDQERIRTTVLAAIHARRIYSAEFRIHRPDGSLRWVVNRGRATYGPGGEPETVLGTITDVTDDRLAVEYARIESEARCKAALDSAAISFVIHAPDGRLVHANAAFSRLTGRAAERLHGLAFADLIHPDDCGAFVEGVNALLGLARTEWITECRFLRANEGFVWGKVSLSAVSEAGRLLWLALFIEDVTPRIEAEAALRLANQLFATTLEASSAVVFSQDLDLRYSWIHNPALGYRSDEVRGRRDADLFERPQDAEATEAFKREVIASGRPAQREVQIWAAGVARCYDLFAQPERDASGAITGVLCAAVDITDRKAAERRLKEREAQLRLFIEHAPASIAMFDRAMRYLAVSRRFLTDHQIGECDLVGRSHYEVFPDLPERWKAIHQRCLAGATEGGEADAVVRRDGTVDLVRWTMQPWQGEDGAVGGVLLLSETVTARVRHAQQTQRSADMFYQLVCNNPFGTFVVDADFRLAYVSRGAEKTFEHVDPLIGRDFAEVMRTLWPEHAAQHFIDLFRRTLSTGEPFEAVRMSELRRDIAAKSAYDWRIERIPLPDDRFGVVCYFYDLTEQERQASRLRDAESNLHVALDAAALKLWQADLPRDHFDPSPAAAALFGLTGSGPWSVDQAIAHVAEPDRVNLRLRLEKLAGSTEVFNQLCRIEGTVGSSRWIALAAQGIPDESGRCGRIVGTVRDVTEQVNNEQALEATNLRLLEATRAGEIGIHEYHPNEGLLIWDVRMREWWGLGPDETPTYEKFVSRLHPDDRAAMQAAVDRSLNPSGDGRYNAEYRVIHPDGTQRWMQATGQVTFADGQAVRMLGTVQDISARRHLLERLQAADRQKDVFLATLSHELRNPLSPVMVAAELLARPNVGVEQSARASAVIQRQVRHIALLLDDLLDVARITQGTLTLRRERVGLMSIVDAAVETVQPLMDRKSHQLTLELPTHPVTVHVDPLRMAQILSNLLTNAGKYTDPGGQIRLSAVVHDRELRIEVVDTGVGLTAEAMGRLFEMFARVEEHVGRGEDGLGIGLALVRGLVALHGGRVGAESQGPGRGSRFRIVLPEVVGDVANRRDTSPAEQPIARARRVLVVDDNRDSADSMAMLLETMGHAVRVAYTGHEALRLARAFEPDVALLDIGLPDMDGYALARDIRGERWAQGALLVALTGWGQDKDVRLAADAGFDHHLTKPANPADIESLLAGGATLRRRP